MTKAPSPTKRFQRPIIVVASGIALVILGFITHIRVLGGIAPFVVGTGIFMLVRRHKKNPVIAVLTVLLLIAVYIGLLYIALVYGLEHSRPGDF
jgi:hypothetical protein